jgi:hypothetical protein
MNYDLKDKVHYYIKMFALALFSVLFLYVLYDNDSSNEKIRKYTKKSDSLEALMEKYQYDYIELKKKADIQDSILNIKKDNLAEVKGSFNKRKKSPPKTPNDAYNFINKFLGE